MQIQSLPFLMQKTGLRRGFLEAVSHPACQAAPEARWGWSTARQETALAWPCLRGSIKAGQGGVALLGSELAPRGENLSWKQLLGAIQTRGSQLAESPAENEQKSRAGVHPFFAGGVDKPIRCAYAVRNNSPTDLWVLIPDCPYRVG